MFTKDEYKRSMSNWTRTFYIHLIVLSVMFTKAEYERSVSIGHEPFLFILSSYQ